MLRYLAPVAALVLCLALGALAMIAAPPEAPVAMENYSYLALNYKPLTVGGLTWTH